MKFEEVLGALREGKKIRRKSWEGTFKLYIDDGVTSTDFSCGDSIYSILDADDWEIIEEPKKHVVWVAIYKYGDDMCFDASHQKPLIDNELIACKRIEITEGVFDND